jgi:hypothetical protein
LCRRFLQAALRLDAIEDATFASSFLDAAEELTEAAE